MPKKKALWVVDVKGCAKHGGEISVLRDDNKHGKLSYGWDGPDKLIIHHSDEPNGKIHRKYMESIWTNIVETADTIANALNQRESRNLTVQLTPQ